MTIVDSFLKKNGLPKNGLPNSSGLPKNAIIFEVSNGKLRQNHRKKSKHSKKHLQFRFKQRSLI